MSNANGRTSVFTAARMLHKYPWKVSGGGLTGAALAGVSFLSA
jgi:hypothetical protein